MISLGRFLLLALGAIALLIPPRAHAQIEGSYIGLFQFYRKSNMRAELVLEKVRKGFEGVITFSHFEHSVGETVVRARFTVQTTYDTRSKTVRLTFVNWIDAPAYGDYEVGARAGRLETNGQVLSGEGFEFALEGSSEAENMMGRRAAFEAHALTQRRVDDEYKQRSGRYERELAEEIAKAATQAPTTTGRRRRPGA